VKGGKATAEKLGLWPFAIRTAASQERSRRRNRRSWLRTRTRAVASPNRKPGPPRR